MFSFERSVDAWILNSTLYQINWLFLSVCIWIIQWASPPRLCARLLWRVRWLDWHFVTSLSFGVCSRAVVPLDPQRIPHLHPAGQKALCLPDNGKPLYLQGGLFRQRQLLLHRFQFIYFQECFLQLHPPCPSEWTLVSHFHFSGFRMQRWCVLACMHEADIQEINVPPSKSSYSTALSCVAPTKTSKSRWDDLEQIMGRVPETSLFYLLHVSLLCFVSVCRCMWAYF